MALRDVLFYLAIAFVQAETDDHWFTDDPYRKYRPPPARSLPIQILLTGIVLTLTTVLFIHLIFTAQYHWPLAPVNYALQLSGVTTLLITLIATLCVILSYSMNESSRWPYMLSYIAVNVPPLDGLQEDEDAWTPAERATWLTMNATTSGLIQITHIQFLTLLYPSRLEKRVIFAVLGPMAFLAAIMQLVPIQEHTDVNYYASAVKNVCNATLSLLFTAALFFWGFFVNKEGAWRTDGGTAAFGASALALAVVSTGLNFLYIPKAEEYVWLPLLMWAVILWQSFLGWWWWVGAGSGAESSMAAQKRREKKEKRRNLRNERPRRAMNVLRGVASTLNNGSSRGEAHEETEDDVRVRPRRRRSQAASHRSSSLDSHSRPSLPRRHTGESEHSDSSGEESDSVETVPPRYIPSSVYHWFASIRHAHLSATQKQTAERLERLRELERAGAAPRRPAVGWGLGSFGWRMNRDQEETQDHSIELEPVSSRSTARDVDRDRNHNEGGHDREVSEPPRRDHRPRTIFWLGPLQRWRLQDSAVYN